MRIVFLITVLVSTYSSTFAQHKGDAMGINGYRHSISYIDHISAFQLMAFGVKPKSIDPDKKYYWYSRNALQITQGGYSERLLHGSYVDQYINGNLREQGLFDLGLKVGEWTTWSNKGLLQERATYRAGHLHGDFMVYDSLGNISVKGNYKNGKKNGIWSNYLRSDSVLIIRYQMGQINKSPDGVLRKIINKLAKVTKAKR